MANNYNDIMNLVNAGNKMGLSNTITRDNGIPLDLSSVQASYNDAVIYAATKAIAYQGQILAAEGVVYLIVAESQGQVEIDGTSYENYLKPVGTVPVGDNASISVTADGLVSIFGFTGAANGMLPVREDGKIVWKTLEAIGAGDGNDNTTYTFALGADGKSIDITPALNGVAGKTVNIALNVYTAAEADEKFLAKVDYTEYDDTAIKGRLDTVEESVTDHETRLGKVETFFATAEGETLDQAFDTLVEIQKYIDGDGQVAEQVLANKAAIEILNGDVAVAGSVDKKIVDAIAAENLDQYVTEDELTDKGYAVATDVASTYATKDELAPVTQTATNAATKADALETRINDIVATGGEPNTINTIKVNGTVLAIDAQKAVDITVPVKVADLSDGATLVNTVASNTTLAQKGVDDAAAAKTVADGAATQATTNKNDIAALTTRVDEHYTTVEGEITAIETDITDNVKAPLAALQTTANGHTASIATNTQDIAALKDKDTELAALIAGNTNKFADYSTTEQMNTAISDALNGFDQSALEESIAANTEAIAAEKTRAEAAEKANADAITALTNGQVKTNTDAIAALDATLKAAIDNDSEGLDSIKELASWINEHGAEAADMSKAITALETKVDTGDQTVSEYVAAQIQAGAYDLPVATLEALGGVKLSEEIGLDEDNALKINKVSTDVLVNGTRELVLNGGNASGAVTA